MKIYNKITEKLGAGEIDADMDERGCWATGRRSGARWCLGGARENPGASFSTGRRRELGRSDDVRGVHEAPSGELRAV